ncbi:Hypothetical protein R9X50_00725700 [Acrodontium crateriforme]|uniref:Purple acid phosphatase n=1 Tax=Acrodontium crateriforme TaxID=150365 RepID=A0AAQ3MDS4_9PEZI|nr:Hypothetical protein R9X50_00725700 [Acrodontium crateriforme]
MRSSMVVSAFAAVGAASSSVGNAFAPSQVRLAYAGDKGMHVSWNTQHKVEIPIVRYGTSPYRLDQIAFSDVSVTYPTSTTYNNHVKITGLKPNTQYYYQPGFSFASKPYTFKTSRKAGDCEPFEVAVVVDMGTMGADGLTTHGGGHPLQPGEINTIQSLQASLNEFEFLWHPGDIAYADYWLKEEIQGFLPNTTVEEGAKVYERILNEFYEEMAPITSLKPYMVGPGNHEANCDNGGTTDKVHNITYDVSICMPGQTNFTGYRNHFRMPSKESNGLENFFYSFDHGMAHFIQLDTETDLGHGFVGPDEVGGSENEDTGPFARYMDQQTDWLAKDLASVDRSKTPWIVVSGHRPWYISAQNKSSTVCWECKDVFEPLFYQHNVDLVLSGHVHAYERIAPIYNLVVDPNGLMNPRAPWYITNGAAGHYDGLDTLVRPLQTFSRYAEDSAYGWSKLKFHNATHLTHEFVASSNGTVLDSATLYKARK